MTGCEGGSTVELERQENGTEETADVLGLCGVKASHNSGSQVSPSTGAMALDRAVLVLLVLSSLRVCGAEPPPGPPQGLQWVWGVAGQARAEPPRLSRSRRDDGGQQPGTATPEHDPTGTAMPKNIETDSPEPDLLLGSVPPPGTNASLHQAPAVTTTADPLDETDSPEPDLLLSSAPSTNASLRWALTVPTSADPQDETDSPEPDLMLSSAPAPSTNASLHWAHVVPSTADPLDETDSPEPDLMLSSAPAPSTNTSLYRALMVPTTADAQDETDSPDPDLLLSSVPPAEPATQTAPQKGVTTVPSWLTPPAPWDMEPWEPSRVVGKCLLAILLLGLVAAIFLLSTGVLGALLWRRTRTAQRQLSHTEMLLLDGGSEADGDNLTLSSFLPEHT
ncbi:proline-rich receptor-like protein kinase PERK8 [Patagioenas fasciata monilis]|uniref:Proline-rich receptor-like protein kinase PERK8 n=1 Tax=Patagioenas fasciata monilis TaxID=372326 RepID=A0A1V4JS24_PATFA|nr:proline-rich receptor-like protein kinase PERK8 [Patagioenas fasciata monilis]